MRRLSKKDIGYRTSKGTFPGCLRKPVFISLALMILLTSASCGHRKQPHETISAEELSQDIITGLAEGFRTGEIDVTTREKKLLSSLITYALENPEASMATLKEAMERAGIKANFPDSFEGIEPYYTAAQGVLSAIYKTEDGNGLVISKSTDSDYASMVEENKGNTITQKIGDKSVSLIVEDGKIHDALWKDGENYYSISSEYGIDESTLKSLIKNIN